MSQTTAAPKTGVQSQSGSRVFWVRVGLSVFLVIVVLGIGAAGFNELRKLKTKSPAREVEAKVYNVDVVPITRVDLPQRISAHGTAVAERDTTISAQVSGNVFLTGSDGKLLKEGDPVTAKQLLVGIDPTSYQQRYEQADLLVKADIEEYNLTLKEQSNNRIVVADAKADKAEYQKIYQRYVNAIAKGATDESNLSQAKLELQQYQKALTNAENNQALFPLRLKQIALKRQKHEKDRDVAKTEWDRSKIFASFDGVLMKVHVQPGQFVRVGDPLVRVASKKVVEIPMGLSYEDYLRIAPLIRKPGPPESKPEVELSTGEDRPYQWTGHVVRVSPFADELTRTIKVYVRVENQSSQAEVKPGMHYHGVIKGPALERVMAVPRDAIVEKKIYVATDLKKKTIMLGDRKYEVQEGIARERRVTIIRTMHRVAIIDGFQTKDGVDFGMKEGEHLILTNLDAMHDGVKVRVRPEQIRNLGDELRPPQ